MALTPVKKLSEVGSRPRQSFEYETLLLAPNATEAFVFNCGYSAIVQRLQVSAPCMVEMWAAPDRNSQRDPNPYTFVATSDHLLDDGTTFLRDGSILKTRQYSIFVNQEAQKQPRMYGYITNTGSQPVKIKLTIQYLTVEDI